jgi:cytochrome bd-type quinol oxidase subunit 2
MSNRIRINRQTRLFERATTWIGLGVVLFIILTAVVYGLYQPEEELTEASRSAMFNLTVGLGILVVLLIAIVTFYSARKRLLQETMPGTMMAWLKSHIYLAFLALGLALVHGFLAIFNSETSSGRVTLGIFVLLVVSGIAWRIVYTVVPPVVSNKVGNLAAQDTRSKSQIVQIDIE